jgi:hypothetical protein
MGSVVRNPINNRIILAKYTRADRQCRAMYDKYKRAEIDPWSHRIHSSRHRRPQDDTGQAAVDPELYRRQGEGARKFPWTNQERQQFKHQVLSKTKHKHPPDRTAFPLAWRSTWTPELNLNWMEPRNSAYRRLKPQIQEPGLLNPPHLVTRKREKQDIDGSAP